MASVHVFFKDLTGESIADMRIHSSLPIGRIAGMLAEKVPLPARKVYRIVSGVEPLPTSDALSKHMSGDRVELTACADSEDSESEASDEKPQKDKKAAKSGKSSKDKKKDKKDKKKKDKSSKKKKGKSASEEEVAPPMKPKKEKNEPGADYAEDGTDKAVWIKEKIDELRHEVRPPLPIEACILRAKKAWAEYCEKASEKKAEEEEERLPQMVKDAVREAGEEARAKGMSEEEVQKEMDIAQHFSMKVAKDNGLVKEIELEEDPTKVPLFFQKRPGLARSLHVLEAMEE